MHGTLSRKRNLNHYTYFTCLITLLLIGYNSVKKSSQSDDNEDLLYNLYVTLVLLHLIEVTITTTYILDSLRNLRTDLIY